MNVVAFLDRSILALAGPQILADLGLSHVELSVLVGFGFVIFFVFFGIPCGWIVDRSARRVIVFLGVTVWSLGAAACGLAHGFWQLLLARIAVGAGESVLHPAAYSLLTDVVPRRRLAFAMTVYGGSAGLGAAVSVAGGGLALGYASKVGDIVFPLIGTLHPWQIVLVLTGVPGLILAPWIFLVPEPARRDRLTAVSSAQDAAFVRFLRSHRRLLITIFAGFSVLQILSFSFSTWEPTYLVRRFGWNISAVGVALSAGMLLSFLGSFAAGWAVDALIARGWRDATLRWAATFAAVCAILIATAFVVPNAWFCVIVVSVAQIPLSLIGVLSTALQQVTPNEFRGRVAAIFLLFGNAIGFGLGPFLPALLTDHMFKSEAKLGISITIVALLSGFASTVIFASGCAPLRSAVLTSRRWTSGEDRP